jgi:hypothetical protein
MTVRAGNREFTVPSYQYGPVRGEVNFVVNTVDTIAVS